MFAGISTFLFGESTSDARFDDENAKLNDANFLEETDDNEWVIVEIHSEKLPAPPVSARVPQDSCRAPVPEQTTKNTRTASRHTNAPQSNNSNGTMEGSWFVTPPPCFTHPNTFMMESSPLEDILIEHPSISVFSPRPPPAELKPVFVAKLTKEQSPRQPSFSDSERKSVKSCKKPQDSENLQQQRTNVCDPVAKAGLFAEITNILAPMQKAKEVGSQKYLKKSFMNRQNKVAHRLNARPSRRNKLTTTINGYSINRKMC